MKCYRRGQKITVKKEQKEKNIIFYPLCIKIKDIFLAFFVFHINDCFSFISENNLQNFQKNEANIFAYVYFNGGGS